MVGSGMSSPLDPSALATIATNREFSLFAEDLTRCTPQIRDAVEGRRVLVIGGAGSIGTAAVRTLLPFTPAHLHIIDQDENGLAELVRDLRSGPAATGVPDLRTLPLDYGAPAMRRFVEDEPPYHLILNFAALKHVRSEKDIYSLTQLLDTNVVRQARFLDWIAKSGRETRYFSVSTDKAANPVNLMGVSKRVMEHVMFSGIRPLPTGSRVTSARFANVAFSAGSLLDSFLRRIARRQPLAVPRETFRYFVSTEEAGQICVIAATAVPNRHIAFPRLSAQHDLRRLDEIAAGVVERSGWTPTFVDDEDAARAAMERLTLSGRYPIMLTERDTSGEKPFEEFVARGEREVEIGFAKLAALSYQGVGKDALRECLSKVEALAAGERRATKREVIEWIRCVEGIFEHLDTGRNLDERM